MEWVVALLVVGAVLLFLETILPGMIAGILGVLCLIGGVIAGYENFGVRGGNLILAIVAIGCVVGVSLWVRFFPNSRMARIFISQKTVGDIRAEQPELMDQTGTAFTQLRPCGMALINGKRVDVVTEGGLVERGARVKVIALEGMRVVVRPIEDEPKN